jgi:membrane protein implicated in regulation of membrane protease activity|tara:strand:- start:285 stop:632 length:348 start_codon:yes stop_codon:yes gene_type:complete
MKKIPQIIASLKLICLAAIIISAFVAIWTDGTLALQIAGTAVLGLVVLWFVSHVFRNVFDAIVKEQVKEQMVQRKSKWQQKLESIQAEQKQKESNTFITETLDEMLADSIKEDTK